MTFRFIRKLWRLFHNEANEWNVSAGKASDAEMKVLHKTIKKIQEDIERFSFNTGVSQFMICVNELTDLKCNKQEILEPLVKLISPYAPHLAEELWQLLGKSGNAANATFPEFEEKYLVENTFSYPVSFNGKTRFILDLPIDMDAKSVETVALAAEESKKWLEGKEIKKIFVVQKRIINIVL